MMAAAWHAAAGALFSVTREAAEKRVAGALKLGVCHAAARSTRPRSCINAWCALRRRWTLLDTAVIMRR